MNEKPNYEVGDIVKLKKPHPCGSSQWEILRVEMCIRDSPQSAVAVHFVPSHALRDAQKRQKRRFAPQPSGFL